MSAQLLCLRCPGVTLTPSPKLAEGWTFFECPSCRRSYQKGPNGALTYRWLHPLTLALYPVIFDQEPVYRAEAIAATFVQSEKRDDLLTMADEIELELTHPTQPVRDALDNYASEQQCREYLRAFVLHLRKHLDRSPVDGA